MHCRVIVWMKHKPKIWFHCNCHKLRCSFSRTRNADPCTLTKLQMNWLDSTIARKYIHGVSHFVTYCTVLLCSVKSCYVSQVRAQPLRRQCFVHKWERPFLKCLSIKNPLVMSTLRQMNREDPKSEHSMKGSSCN